jgi:hypothetical protein
MPNRRPRFGPNHLCASVVVAFASGFSIAYLLYPTLSAYPNAETCAIHAQNRWSVGACYDLYPTVHELSEQKKRAELQAKLEKDGPGRYKVLTSDEAEKLSPGISGAVARH